MRNAHIILDGEPSRRQDIEDGGVDRELYLKSILGETGSEGMLSIHLP
jgi:hypothetical protein